MSHERDDGQAAGLMAPGEESLASIETAAVAMAREAGQIVDSFFGRPLEVEYKDKGQSDPVTAADKQSQAHLTEAISRSFPGHGILGEEGPEEDEEGSPAPDYLWVLDPLDGTTNFLNGFPLYAVSIGVLYRGLPVAGALYIPWPQRGEGLVLHARRGAGAFVDGQRLSLGDPEEPVAKRLSGVPGSIGSQFRVRKQMRGKFGELRVSGSIAYELAMVARGVIQYSILGGPKLWDVAGGALVVAEAGGSVVIRQGRRWEPLDALVPHWDSHPPTIKELRRWAHTIIAADGQVAPFVAANLRRRRLPLTARIVRWVRRQHRKRASGKGKPSNETPT